MYFFFPQSFIYYTYNPMYSSLQREFIKLRCHFSLCNSHIAIVWAPGGGMVCGDTDSGGQH